MIISKIDTPHKQGFLPHTPPPLTNLSRRRASANRTYSLSDPNRELARIRVQGAKSQAPMADIEEAPAFCIPCEGTFTTDCSWRNGTCFNGECEGLHLSARERREHLAWSKPMQQKVIIAAGPERSGSTWLFNAVRLLLKSARVPYDPYWITSLEQQKLQQREQYAQGRHVVIKTHYWSDDWDVAQADHIFLTHRDLQGVVASYRRVGWAFNIPDSYVQEHQQWRAVAQRDIAYENIMSQPASELQALAEALGIAQQINVTEVNEELQRLKPASSGAPDPVSKLWPGHYSAEVQQKHDEGFSLLTDEEQTSSKSYVSKQPAQGIADQLKYRFPEYFRQYGYD